MNGSTQKRKHSSKMRRKDPFVFIPNLTEVIGGRLRLRYSTVNNTYYRDYDDTINPNTSNVKVNWESVVYESTGIQQYRNETHDELYLGRKSNHKEAILSWKFDFAASGLVVDTVQVKVEAVLASPSKLKLLVEGDDVKVSAGLTEEINYSRIKELEGSTKVVVAITVSADEPGRFAKLFLQSTAARKFDCPLDINIRLKRPNMTIGRSLLLLGLMYSKEQLIDLRKRPWKRRPQSEGEAGFLYIHVHEAKRLPLRAAGALPDPQVKCKLLVGDRSLACKTLRARKSVNPVWDEQHVIEGISLETIKSAKLEIKVIHDVLSFNKSKRREILGTSTIESSNQSDSKSDEEDSTPPPLKGTRGSLEMSCTKLHESDRIGNLRKGSYEEDMLDMFMNGPRNDAKCFEVQSSEGCLNKHISVSLTSLQSAAQNSISDIDEEGRNSWKSQLNWKGFGKVLGIGNKQGNKEQLTHKRPSIVLSNSQETIVVLNADNRSEEDLKNLSDETISENEEVPQTRSCSNLLSTNGTEDLRRSTLTPTAIQNMDGLLEPFAQLQQTAKLASAHWDRIPDHKEEWLYCWHPLTLR